MLSVFDLPRAEDFDRTVTVVDSVDRGDWNYFTTARFWVTRFDGHVEANLDAVSFDDVPAGEHFELTDEELYRLERKAVDKALHDYWC